MIFVTVGAQEPFDRLVQAVDHWVGERGDTKVFAQIGETNYRPEHMEWVERLSPAEYRLRAERAEVTVSHAGMGTILTALELGKPLLVMPRLARLRETRNDHQLGTARRMEERGWLQVVQNEQELCAALDASAQIPACEPMIPQASSTLLDALRDFIRGDETTTE